VLLVTVSGWVNEDLCMSLGGLEICNTLNLGV
jgi:hypothetical protein